MVACERMRGHVAGNIEALREIQGILAELDIDRPLARILDALLWSAHPGTDPSHTGVIEFTPCAD
jgi:hypothetical protein